MPIRCLILSTALLIASTTFASAGTHTVGDACAANQFGQTELDKKETGVIGCFRTAEGSTIYQWKAIGGSGGGVGPCFAFTGLDEVIDPLPAGISAAQIVTIVDGTVGYASGTIATCNPGYTRTNCSGYASLSQYAIHATPIPNGCFAPMQEYYAQDGGNSFTSTAGTMNIVCCKSQ